jgi:hypothetical protein
MDQHQGALALPVRRRDLLAVPAAVADEIEQVVLDLKGRAHEEPEPLNRSRSLLLPSATSAPMRPRVDAGVPTSSFKVIRR